MGTGVLRPGEVLWVQCIAARRSIVGTGVVRPGKYYCGYWCSAASRSIVGTGVVRPGEVLWVLV